MTNNVVSGAQAFIRDAVVDATDAGSGGGVTVSALNDDEVTSEALFSTNLSTVSRSSWTTAARGPRSR